MIIPNIICKGPARTQKHPPRLCFDAAPLQFFFDG